MAMWLTGDELNGNLYGRYALIIGIVCCVLLTTIVVPMESLSSIPSKQTRQYQFAEDFETGYDNWEYHDGGLSYHGTQSAVVYKGSNAFKMTGSIDSDGAYSGNYKHTLNIPVNAVTQFQFVYNFPSKEVSYVGYYLTFDTNKMGYYISLFSGSFVDDDKTYLLQYKSESVNTWHSHTENVYDNYQNAFGSVPTNLHITGIYMMMGDPYYSSHTQTAYFDDIVIGENISSSVNGNAGDIPWWVGVIIGIIIGAVVVAIVLRSKKRTHQSSNGKDSNKDDKKENEK